MMSSATPTSFGTVSNCKRRGVYRSRVVCRQLRMSATFLEAARARAADCGIGPDPGQSARRGPFEIFATHSTVDGHATIRVYLACDGQAASAAVASQTFDGVWTGNRMSWVKPSAAWMAYRCGWTVHKDRRQTNVLGLDVARPKFEELLLQAMVTHGHGEATKGDTSQQQPPDYKSSPVVVQWDPERELDPAVVEKTDSPFLRKLVETRSLQVGLRGTAWTSFFTDPTYVLRISDVTASFRAAHDALLAGELEAAKAALWPAGAAMRERRFDASPELTVALGISGAAPEQTTVFGVHLNTEEDYAAHHAQNPHANHYGGTRPDAPLSKVKRPCQA